MLTVIMNPAKSLTVRSTLLILNFVYLGLFGFYSADSSIGRSLAAQSG